MFSKEKKLKRIKNISKSKNGKCLSDEYVNVKTKLKFQCDKGHIWETLPHIVVSNGSWCPYCAGKTRNTEDYLNEIKQVAKEKGGECLSNEYMGSFGKLKFRCAKGHEWFAAPHHIKKENGGTWCPHCVNKGKTKNEWLQEIKEIAIERGGECLSDEYIHNKVKLEFRCKDDHTWEAIPKNIKKGTWCPYCAKKSNRRTRHYNVKKILICDEISVLFINDNDYTDKMLMQFAKTLYNKQHVKKVSKLNNVYIIDNAKFIETTIKTCKVLVVIDNIFTVNDLLLKFNISRNELADSLDLSVKTINNWCQGQCKIPHRHWQKIKEIYGVEITV